MFTCESTFYFQLPHSKMFVSAPFRPRTAKVLRDCNQRRSAHFPVGKRLLMQGNLPVWWSMGSMGVLRYIEECWVEHSPLDRRPIQTVGLS